MHRFAYVCLVLSRGCFAAMERLKPFPQGFLASVVSDRSQEALSPTKPAGVSSNPRTAAAKLPSIVTSSSASRVDSRRKFVAHMAIDANPLPGQIVSSGVFSLDAKRDAEVNSMTDEDAGAKVFWIKISATNLPRTRGADVDAVCVVWQAGSVLHVTEVALNDADPDFNVALKLDSSVNRAKPLEFRIYDATELELEEADDGAGVLVQADDIKRLTGAGGGEGGGAGGGGPGGGGQHKGILLHESFVNIETLERLIDNLLLRPVASLIHKERDRQRRSDMFLSIFPVQHSALQLLDGDRQLAFEMQDDMEGGAGERVAAMKHDTVLDVLPWHLCTIQNAVATVATKDKGQESAKGHSDVMSLVLEAKQYKQLCLGSTPDSEKRAKSHPEYSCLVNTMKKLKEAALTRPEDFYQMSSFGSPVILFGFLIGALHNLCEDFGIERPAAEDFHPECKGDDELMDWWDIMYWLKQGLLDSCIESDKHGRHGDMFAEAAAQLYGIHTDSMETVADYEFQWLLCRPYSNQILTLKDAWQSIKDGHDKLAVSNEYSGENLLHVLIVQNMSEKYQLPWHLAVLFGKFVTRPQFRWNLMNEKVTGRFFCPVHGGHTDLGQTPLHFAVSLGSAETVKTLLKLCEDNASRHKLLWECDSIGNNIFHMCVKHNSTAMYDLLWAILSDLEKVLKKSDWWHFDGAPRTLGPKTIADDDCLKNSQGRTPVEFAASLGNMDFICHIIEKDKMTKWAYGDISLNMNLIRDFDSYKTVTHDRGGLQKGSKYKNWLSKIIASVASWAQPRTFYETNVLQLLVDHKQKELLNNLPIIKGILEHKYQTFGRHILAVWFVVMCCIFALFEVNVYMKASAEVESDSETTAYQMLPISHPAAILQTVIAAALLLFSFLYCVDEGVTEHVAVGHTGVELQFQTHRAEDFLKTPVEHLLYAAQPFWMMTGYYADFMKTDAAEKSNYVSSFVEKRHHSSHFIEKHLDMMKKSRVQAAAASKSEAARPEYEGAAGSKRRLPWDWVDSKVAIELARCAMLLAKLLFNAIISSISATPLQLWATLVLIEKCIYSSLESRVADVLSTALVGLASFAFFFSFLLFYRVSDKLGPFMVLIRQMILGDLVKWGMVVVLFVLATAQAMHVILNDDMSFLYAYQWLLGDSTMDFGETRHEVFATFILVLFVVLTLVLSVALLNTLIAMFGSTYSEVMEKAPAEWMLQRAELMLLIERVLYFCPAAVLRLLGYRVLPKSKGKRKTILRFIRQPGGKTYIWVNIRCGMRPALDANHEEELRESAKQLAADQSIASVSLNPLMSFPVRWHSVWTATVPDFIAQYHQVENDDDLVYLLSFQSIAEKREA